MEPITIPKIVEQLKKLPPDKLSKVYEFVSYLAERGIERDLLSSEAYHTMLASESVLRRDRDRLEEDDKLEREKIHRESEAFLEQHQELLRTKKGQYVALHEGQVVDQDQDGRSLYLRIRTKYGQIPVLIRQVTEQGQRVLIFRSPRLEKGNS